MYICAAIRAARRAVCAENHLRRVLCRLFTNKLSMDFSEAEEAEPLQEIQFEENCKDPVPYPMLITLYLHTYLKMRERERERQIDRGMILKILN